MSFERRLAHARVPGRRAEDAGRRDAAVRPRDAHDHPRQRLPRRRPHASPQRSARPGRRATGGGDASPPRGHRRLRRARRPRPRAPVRDGVRDSHRHQPPRRRLRLLPHPRRRRPERSRRAVHETHGMLPLLPHRVFPRLVAVENRGGGGGRPRERTEAPRRIGGGGARTHAPVSRVSRAHRGGGRATRSTRRRDGRERESRGRVPPRAGGAPHPRRGRRAPLAARAIRGGDASTTVQGWSHRGRRRGRHRARPGRSSDRFRGPDVGASTASSETGGRTEGRGGTRWGRTRMAEKSGGIVSERRGRGRHTTRYARRARR